MNFTFFPYSITYKVKDNKAVIYIFGKTKDGERVCVVDDSFEPYFYVLCEDYAVEEIKKTKTKDGSVSRAEWVTLKLLEKPVKVLKVFADLPKSVPDLRKAVQEITGVKDAFEYDILFARRYLIDKNILPMTAVECDAEPIKDDNCKVSCFLAKKLVPKSEVFSNPKILAIDTEVYNPDGRNVSADKHPVIMASFVSDSLKKVITWKHFETNEPSIEFVPSEADLLLRFKEIFEKEKPDIVTGYFSDGFDFPYLKARAKKYRIPFDIGLDGSEIKISGEALKTTSITGIVHMDTVKFIRNIVSRSLETDVFTLDAVASELLGAKKQEVNLDEFADVCDNHPERLIEFCNYNLHDSLLAYELCKKLLPSIIEISRTVGLPLDDSSRMSFAQLVEWFLIKRAHEENEICPNKPSFDEQQKRMSRRLKGAFVFEPRPGFYENLCVLDFRSIYPSIIASHNISIGTMNCSCCSPQQAPTEYGKFWFCEKKNGFLSGIIKYLIEQRVVIKKQLKTSKDPFLSARSEALKYLANSFYGYLGYALARWYCFECGECVTAWGRKYIQQTISLAEKSGFTVIYSDTDSIFLVLDKKSKDDVFSLIEKVNSELPGIMELDLEGFYPAGIFVSVKVGEFGAKKKYALIDELGKLKVRGFETVRRNWSFIAKEVQKEVLKIILQERNPEKAIEFIKRTIQDLKENKIPKEKVVIYTQLQKNIDTYTSIGPHVAAAQRLKNKGFEVRPGDMLKFIVVRGKGLIRDKVRLVDEETNEQYDADYYIENQILPSVERILLVLGYKKEDIVQTKQRTLGSFA